MSIHFDFQPVLLGCLGEIIFLVFFCMSPAGIKGATYQMLGQMANFFRSVPSGER